MKYAAGMATTTTITVDATATMTDVRSQARKRSSPSTSLNVVHFHTAGRTEGGVRTTSLLGRKALSSMTR